MRAADWKIDQIEVRNAAGQRIGLISRRLGPVPWAWGHVTGECESVDSLNEAVEGLMVWHEEWLSELVENAADREG